MLTPRGADLPGRRSLSFLFSSTKLDLTLELVCSTFDKALAIINDFEAVHQRVAFDPIFAMYALSTGDGAYRA